ncbi:MAG TPA: hypothetical protein VLE93_01370 [Candidatus Saccharimonadales bacterium]|nr:hypothetical protein [Candidatus Saccharimonadales bacterium]
MSQQSKSQEHQLWGHLNRELAKLYEICEVYEKLFQVIEQKNNRYNPAFQLFLDNMTAYIYMSVARFFDGRDDSWSLYSYELLDKTMIDNLKKRHKPIIKERHKFYAHLSRELTHASYRFLSSKGIEQIRRLLDALKELLIEINVKYKYSEEYAMTWIGLQGSIDNMLYDLKNFDHMKEFEELV